MRSLFREFFDVVPLCGPTAQLLWAWGVAVATPPFEAVYKPTTPGKSSYLAHVQCIQTSSFKCVLEPFASTSLRFIGGIAIYSSTSSHPIYSAFQHLLVLRTLFRAVAHKPPHYRLPCVQSFGAVAHKPHLASLTTVCGPWFTGPRSTVE